MSPLTYAFIIPVVNRLDLLERALASLGSFRGEAIVIDNTPERKAWGPTRQTPPVPLSCSQTMNWAFRMFAAKDVLLFMHNDGVASEDVVKTLLLSAETWRAQSRQWGVAFTYYDVLAMFNMRLMPKVGLWDTNLPQYFTDNDFYRRVRLAGLEAVDTGLPVQHDASSTIRSDPRRNFVNGVTFPLYAAYYRSKWGGDPGQERYDRPFAGELDRLPVYEEKPVALTY